MDASESKSEWDAFTLVGTIPVDKAFRPLNEASQIELSSSDDADCYGEINERSVRRYSQSPSSLARAAPGRESGCSAADRLRAGRNVTGEAGGRLTRTASAGATWLLR